MEIFKAKYELIRPLRSIGVRACDLVPENSTVQLSLLYDHAGQERMERLERSIDELRDRYGHFIIQKGMLVADEKLGRHNAKEHVIHPVGVFKGPMEI